MPKPVDPTRRGALALGLGHALGLGAAWPAGADAARGITLLVPYPAGGASDALARQLAPELAAALGRPVQVVNVSGASGALAAQKLLAAPADGSTLMLLSSSETILPPLLMPGVKYRAEDFTLLVGPLSVPLALLARPGLPAQHVDALLAHARQPGQPSLRYGSLGHGSVSHLAALDFERLTGLEMVHVPYRGGAPLSMALAGEQLDICFMPFAAGSARLAEQGRIKVLGLSGPSSAAQQAAYARLADHPQLRGFAHAAWTSFAVAAATPAALAQTLNQSLNRILQLPAMQQAAISMGAPLPAPASLAEAAAFYRSEVARVRALARALPVRLD
ncbi:tripartite tricarboxylate transporter substrate binding protein [Paucibacter soli]|uniref:tripartite tricarboxylate transporter substrate binding protein n=1 Tax=Paucibacter soli TaxID=3133433 RepID=UPI0030A2E34B